MTAYPTTATPAAGLSLLTVIRSDRPGPLVATPELDAALGTVEGVGTAERHLLLRGLTTALDDVVEVDLTPALARGLGLYRELKAAARTTLSDPGSTERVSLARHDVESEWHPTIDVMVGRLPVHVLVFDLDVTFRLEALWATVRQGRLVRLDGGRCDLLVNLGLHGETLLERTYSVPDHAFGLRLGRGVDLLGPPTQRDQGAPTVRFRPPH